eukprot:scaffold16484_cov33-Tisochrysis_lutea.AAC.2
MPQVSALASPIDAGIGAQGHRCAGATAKRGWSPACRLEISISASARLSSSVDMLPKKKEEEGERPSSEENPNADALCCCVQRQQSILPAVQRLPLTPRESLSASAERREKAREQSERASEFRLGVEGRMGWPRPTPARQSEGETKGERWRGGGLGGRAAGKRTSSPRRAVRRARKRERDGRESPRRAPGGPE